MSSDTPSVDNNGEATSVDTARVELYDIMQEDTDFQTKAQAVLDLGVRHLGVDNAHLTRINQAYDRWDIVASTDSADGTFPAGLTLDLGTTYCRRVLDEDSSVAIHDTLAQGWDNDVAFKMHGIHCYHGTQITVDDELYGTVCFVSESPRDEPFSDADTLFAELIARLLEHELNHSRQVEENTRRGNSITVLSRVLRHNLRNEMTVVRGRARTLADRLAAKTNEDVVTDPLFSSIDRIIDLSDKTRKLESVIATKFERESIALDSLLNRVSTQVQSQFPNADIMAETSSNLSVFAAPSLELAIGEIVENAAKHAGSNPEVIVTTTMTADTVELSVADNGPGLPDDEREVLSTGVETPLIHGSGLGLWMVYWIVTTHDGTIETAVTDEGTVVTVTLPQVDSAVATDQDVPTLRRGRDRFEAVFEESFNAMLIVDDNRRIIDVNKHATTLLGNDGQDILGQQLGEFTIPPFDLESDWEDLQATGQTDGEVFIQGDESTEYVLEYRGVADIIPGQHLIVGQDITERNARKQALEETHQKLETILDVAEFAIFLKDSDGIYQILNTTAREMFDIDIGQDITGLTDFDLFPQETAETYRADDQRVIKSSESIEIEEEVPTEQGIRTYLTVKSPVFDENGTPSGVCGIGTDITAQEEHKQLQHDKERLEQFASLLSHDLRNPLTVAQGNVEIAQQDDEDSEELATASLALVRMEELIEDILTVTKQNQDIEETTSVSLSTIATDCWATIDSPEATLQVVSETSFPADQKRIKRLFENLFRNAIEHGESDNCIDSDLQGDSKETGPSNSDHLIRVGSLADGDGFYIENTGTPIPEKKREEIFENGFSTDEESLGLGLAIVNSVVSAHGWTITVTDGSIGGPRFEIKGRV